ncbi:hypothetical protein ACLH0K_09015 [Arthrobacter sp. MPF02]|uniref:hypothetical protein n=1 Tax=Arthrobacter sp. MPF02 TaxID=3388492 RepID=UPI003984BC5F
MTYYVRWIDPESRNRMSQKVDSKENAELLRTVLNAHDNNIDAALKSTRDHFSGVYTVTRMIEDHIDLLTSANGYTLRRYKGNLRRPFPPWLLAGELFGGQMPAVADLAGVCPHRLLAGLPFSVNGFEGAQGQVLGRVRVFLTGHRGPSFG